MRRLRRRIISGTYPPGSRLPTRRALCAELGCSTIIMQQAMDRLIAEGFVRSDGRNGSFVCDHPPHLTQVGVILPATIESNRFWAALSHVVDTLDVPDFTLQCWENVNEHIDNPGHRDILRRVRAHMFAGLIFAFPPAKFKESPILTEPGIARVAVMSPLTTIRNVDRINLARDSVTERTIAYVRERGRTRIAVIVPDVATSTFELWQQALSAQGITLRPYWFQPGNIAHPAAARHLTRLLFREGQADRPDALIIADDNLVEHVTRGVAEAGIAVPDDLDIVAHCNFPWPPATACPVTFFGFDAQTIMEVALERIRNQMAGEPPAHTDISAVFEHERGVGLRHPA